MPNDAERSIDSILEKLDQTIKHRHDETVQTLQKQIRGEITKANKELKAELARIAQLRRKT